MAVNTFSTPNSALNASNYQLPAYGDSAYAYWKGKENYGAGADFVNFFTGVGTQGKERYNAAQSLLDRQFLIDYDSSKYQRAFADLKAAGVNPWLALQNGVSASSASASSYKGHQASESKELDINSLLSSAIKVLGILAIGASGAKDSGARIVKNYY